MASKNPIQRSLVMGKSLKDFLNQPESLRQPTAEDYALAALLNGEVINAPAPLLRQDLSRVRTLALSPRTTQTWRSKMTNPPIFS